MTRLLLIRHAPTPETGNKLTGRRAGVGLDAAGKEVASATATALADVDLAAVYSSPVLRCRQTARIIAEPHGLEITQYRNLTEVDYGTWTGRSLASLRRTKLWQQLLAAPSRTRFPGGELLGDVAARAVRSCEELAGVHGKDTIAVVSHGDVIKAALAHYLGVPVDLFQRLWVAPGSWSVVDLPAAGVPRVLAINRTATGAPA